MSNQQMTDDELRALLDQEIRQSAGYLSGKLSQDRQKALAYYLAKPVGDLAPPEIDGRSSVVSTDVADTVEWMLPSLLRIFAGSDKVVEFNPTHPSDEAAARQAYEGDQNRASQQQMQQAQLAAQQQQLQGDVPPLGRPLRQHADNRPTGQRYVDLRCAAENAGAGGRCRSRRTMPLGRTGHGLSTRA